MKTVGQNQSGPVQSEKAEPGGASRLRWKRLWKRWVLSLEWNSECVMKGERGEHVEDNTVG